MLTFWTIKYYFPLAIVTLALHGLGFSFVYATAIGAAQKWFPKSKKGFVGSIVLSGYGYGSLIWIPLQTSFVNPDNVKAEYDPGCYNNATKDYLETEETSSDCNNRYYTDPDMLARIPWMFLMLGGIYALCGMIATILIAEPDDVYSETMSISSDSADSPKHQVIQHNYKPTEVLKKATFYQVYCGIFQNFHSIKQSKYLDLDWLLQYWIVQWFDVNIQQDIWIDIYQ